MKERERWRGEEKRVGRCEGEGEVRRSGWGGDVKERERWRGEEGGEEM